MLGIGSILGLKKPDALCKKFIVFSSGYAAGSISTYGSLPVVTDQYDIICLRGPLTAQSLHVAEKLAISDGALLISKVVNVSERKKYNYSFMPHIGSSNLYDKWPKIIEKAGVNYISPSDNPLLIINQIIQSKVLMTEALHGAIVADAFRVPWIPIKTNKVINEFKWKDYLSSVGMTYKPNIVSALYSKSTVLEILKNKLKKTKLNVMQNILADLFIFSQKKTVRKAEEEFIFFKKADTYLCSGSILQQRQGELIEAINMLRLKYEKRS